MKTVAFFPFFSYSESSGGGSSSMCVAVVGVVVYGMGSRSHSGGKYNGSA